MRGPDPDKNSAYHMEYFQDEIIDVPDLQQVDVLVQKDKGGGRGNPLRLHNHPLGEYSQWYGEVHSQCLIKRLWINN